MALEPKKISQLTSEQKAALLEALGIQTVLPVLTEYPTTTPSKAGKRFLYLGTEWHYMTQAEIDGRGLNGKINVGFPIVSNIVYYEPYFYISAPGAGTYKYTICTVLPLAFVKTNSITNYYVTGESTSYTVLDSNGVADLSSLIGVTRVQLSNLKIKYVFGLNTLTYLENMGTTPALGLYDNLLSANEINKIFTELPVTTKTATIDVRNNPGAATCTPSIATAKGYTVVL